MSLYPCSYELKRWGEFQVRAIEGFGHSASSPLSRAIEGQSRERQAVSKPPVGIYARGLDEYLLVERALGILGQQYKIVAVAEYAAPVTVVGKSMTKRASAIGVSLGVYRRRLKRIHEEIYKIFDN